MTSRPTRRSEAFFGRRKTKSLNTRKTRLVEELLPALRIDLNSAPPQNLNTLFSHEPDRIILEIGFGGGEHLAHQAAANPGSGYFGVEPFINGMAKMLGKIDDDNLGNIRLFDDDATLLLDWLPDHCLDQIDLLYPDPWPKKRNWKRRFVNQRNLSRFARVLKPAGLFRFASDIDTYVNWTLQHVERSGHFEWLAESADDWRNPWPGFIRTRYEAKAVREGRGSAYLEFHPL